MRYFIIFETYAHTIAALVIAPFREVTERFLTAMQAQKPIYEIKEVDEKKFMEVKKIFEE